MDPTVSFLHKEMIDGIQKDRYPLGTRLFFLKLIQDSLKIVFYVFDGSGHFLTSLVIFDGDLATFNLATT